MDESKIDGEADRVMEAGILHSHLDRFREWTKKCQTLYSVRKCVVMYCGRRNEGIDSKGENRNQLCKGTLGVQVQDSLKVSVHV